MKFIYLFIYFGVGISYLSAQAPITGIVKDIAGSPLPGVNIFFINTTKGTSSEQNGTFSLSVGDTIEHDIVFSYIGLLPDTIRAKSGDNITIALAESRELQTVVIEETRRSFFNTSSAALIENLTQVEFRKAACCNLSESFETNASVDVSFSDAITGAKHISLLGLDGKYVQLTTEQIPSIRGLAAPFGLSYVAGPWLESIQIAKGAGSVVNGYEGLTGQINIELRKPEKDVRLAVNAYVNHMGRAEGNLIATHRLKGGKWFTSILLNGNYFNTPADENGDTFLDLPLLKQISGVHRWKYYGKKMESEFGVRGLTEWRDGGNLAYIQNDSLLTPYGLSLRTWRAEGFGKTGFFFDGQPWKSLGIQANGIYHDQRGFFGERNYTGTQKNAFLNVIYQSMLGNTQHTFKTGGTFIFDEVSEVLDSLVLTRTELVGGGFFEYTYQHLDKVSLVLGGRIDYHSMFGIMPTPRLNFRWEITKGLVFRLSGGRGWRVPNLFAENTTVLVSSRIVNLTNYSITPEVAWNVGTSIQYKTMIGDREISFVTDFFRTDFSQQLLVDREDQTSVKFYNLAGNSFANVFQFTANAETFKNLFVRVAYKWQDVRATYGGVLERVPLVSEHKAFLNLEYKIPKWGLGFDFTTKLNGPGRVPPVKSGPGASLPGSSPWFVLLNAQISKDFKIFDWYVGCENITGYTQSQPIIDAQNPLGNNFDASLVWAPIFGRMFYTGINVKLDYKK